MLMLLLLLAAPADAGLGDAERFSVSLPAEVDLVGLAVGVHPELLWRPFQPDGAFHLRAATGVMIGPELALVPLSFGIREMFFPRKMFRFGLGIGVQMQTFLPYDHTPVVRLDQYLELTADARVADGWRVGLQISPEFGITPGFGLGMAVRLGVQRDLPW